MNTSILRTIDDLGQHDLNCCKHIDLNVIDEHGDDLCMCRVVARKPSVHDVKTTDVACSRA